MEAKRHRTVEPACVTPVSDPHTLDQLCQAAVFHIKLHALRYNPDACAEVRLAIHHWIGDDCQRAVAYNRVRKVLYDHGRSDIDKAIRLAWSDVLLLIVVFSLLLPMICFMAVPI